MKGFAYFVTLIILFINFLGLIFLVFRLPQSFMFEFFIFLLLLIFSLIISIGMYKRRVWIWPLSIIFYIVNILNLIFIKFITLRGKTLTSELVMYLPSGVI